MKRIALILLFAIGLTSVSCEENDPELQEYLVAVPLTMSEEEFENSIDVVAPLPVEESGKIYAYSNLIFINDRYKGIHVIDNSNPLSP